MACFGEPANVSLERGSRNEGWVVVEFGEKGGIQKNGGPLIEILKMRSEFEIIVQTELLQIGIKVPEVFRQNR